MTLSCGSLGTLRRVLGVWMRLGEGEMSIDKSQRITQVTADSLHDRVRPAAVWTFVVAVLNECDRRVRWSEKVVALVHRNCQLC